MTLAKRMRVGTVAMVATLSLLFAGCSDGGGSDAPKESQGSTSTASQKAQTLRLYTTIAPSNFTIGNWNGGDATLFLSVYDTLFHREVDGSIAPGIAEKWEYNEDLTELTMHIRSGLKFTDGEVLDAQAVVDSLNASIAKPGAAAYREEVAEVKKTDDSTVVIVLKQPTSLLIPYLTGWSGAIGAPDVLTSEASKSEPIGSGPYIMDLDKTVSGSKYIFTRNPDYYDLESYPYSDLEISVIADPTAAMNAVQAGQLDFTTLRSPDLVAQFPESKFTSGTGKANSLAALFIVDREGMVVPALKEKKVRQAINMAIDRAAIATGFGAGSMTPTDQVFSPAIGSAYDPALEDAYSYDVDKAKALMAEAGYADGFDVTMPSSVVSTAFEPIITQALGDIGIKVTWEAVPFQDLYTKISSLSYGMYFMINGFAGSDAQDTGAVLSGVFNPFGTTTPELDTLLKNANLVEDGSGFGPVNKYLVDEAWFAPILSIASPYVVSNSVTYTPPVVGSQTVKPWAPAN